MITALILAVATLAPQVIRWAVARWNIDAAPIR